MRKRLNLHKIAKSSESCVTDRDRQILFSPWQVRRVKNFSKMLPKAAIQGQNFEARGWLVYFSCGKLAYSGLFTSLCLWISLRALYKRFVKKSSQRQTHIPDTKVCVMVQTRFSLTKLKVNVSKNQTKSKISGKNAKTRSCSHSGYELSI